MVRGFKKGNLHVETVNILQKAPYLPLAGHVKILQQNSTCRSSLAKLRGLAEFH